MHLSAAGTSRFRDESGFALVTVIGLTAIMTIVAGIALTYAMNNQQPSRNHQDWNGALAAAEAGLDDYLSRLNRDNSYWSAATPDDPLGNDALDADAWAQLPDSEAFYHYTVDASRAASEGLVIVQSTGRVRGQTRTIEASYRPKGFLDYVYFTDLEALDPDIDPACNGQYYFDSPGRNCQAIRFVTNDVIDGPLRSNDRLLIDGDPIFQGMVETPWRTTNPGPYWFPHTGTHASHSPQFQGGLEGPGVDILEMPQTNQAIKDQTSGTAGGCLYYGPTYIRFHDDGSFRVRSPLSVDPPDGEPLPNPNCFQGSVASLASAGGAVVSMDEPFNGVIYVENSETDKCTDGSATHPLGLPTPNEQHAPDEYRCHVGDAYVWGTVSGQVTVAAKRDIKVIWDLVYDGDFETGTDLTGLIADRYVKVWHPVRNYVNWGSTRPTTINLPNTAAGLPPYPTGDQPHSDARTWSNPEIHAAILSLNRTFTVQNFHLGPRFNTPNALTVRGAIAQRYRGPVGVTATGSPGSSGYFKDYRFDWRLRFLSPPYFIAPEESQWVQRTWAELRRPSDLPDF